MKPTKERENTKKIEFLSSPPNTSKDNEDLWMNSDSLP